MEKKWMYNQSPQDYSKNTLPLKECELAIASYSLFCLLNQKSIHELALIGERIFIDEGVVLVKEGELVDSFYLIISGTAKVTRTITTVEKMEVMEVATLEKGEAIGLSEVGFFSHRGIRTGTITATKPMFLLKFGIEKFVKFLQKPDVNYPALRDMGEIILLMNFIQDIDLFKGFSNEKIQQLAKRVKKIIVRAGEVLFNEGDVANNCYFVLSGKISTFTTKNHEQHISEIIGPGSILGEGAFFEHEKRSASARAETDCELFVLEQQWIQPHILNIINNIDRLESQSKTGLQANSLSLWKKWMNKIMGTKG